MTKGSSVRKKRKKDIWMYNNSGFAVLMRSKIPKTLCLTYFNTFFTCSLQHKVDFQTVLSCISFCPHSILSCYSRSYSSHPFSLCTFDNEGCMFGPTVCCFRLTPGIQLHLGWSLIIPSAATNQTLLINILFYNLISEKEFSFPFFLFFSIKNTNSKYYRSTTLFRFFCHFQKTFLISVCIF